MLEGEHYKVTKIRCEFYRVGGALADAHLVLVRFRGFAFSHHVIQLWKDIKDTVFSRVASPYQSGLICPVFNYFC